MKKSMKILSLIMLIILVASASSFSAANTNTTVWSDNFNDKNLDGWEIVGHDWTNYPPSYDLWTGNASAANNELWINGSAPDFYTVVGYPSSVTHGTWSFDVIAKNTARISFVSNNNVSTYTPTAGSHYTLFISSYMGGVLELWKTIGGTTTNLESVNVTGISGHWQHVDITKDTSNLISVYINGTLQFTVTDDTVTKSFHFKFISNTISGLDNVTVSDTVDIEPPTTKSGSLSTVSIIAGLGFMVALFHQRRRRS
ncbi:MAG: hypothetical protein ACXABI_16045 [Candidatus Hodarchaeales archaeon]